MTGVQTLRLLRQVALRQQLIIQGGLFYRSTIAIALIYALALVAARLLSLIPDRIGPVTVLIIPAIAILVAIAVRKRVSATTAARAIDTRMGCDDLFLTAATMDNSPGEFRPLVLARAEEKAGAVTPREVVPYAWRNKLRNIVLILGVILACSWYLPHLDPFGMSRQWQRVAQRRDLLRASKAATAFRIAALEKKDNRVDQVAKAITELEKTFNAAKPDQKEANLKQLQQHQKEMGQLWRQLSDEKLKEALKPNAINQAFGMTDPKKLEQWKAELKKGETTGLKKELEDLKKQARQIAAMPESAEKQKAKEQLQDQLANLSNELAKELNSPQLNAALARAMDQLQMSQMKDLSGDSLQAMQDSLGLSEQELSALAQSMKDLQSLEDGLKNLQMAKMLNEANALDGSQAGACKSLSDYAALYAQLLGQQTQVGPGMRGPGVGQGGIAPQFDDGNKGFKTEQSKSTLTAGKMLLEWKTNEVSESGTATQDYNHAIQQVKQGLSEAILQEQVPPGYHEAIQKYFDTITPPAAKQQKQ